jgi:hypothetical protein
MIKFQFIREPTILQLEVKFDEINPQVEASLDFKNSELIFDFPPGAMPLQNYLNGTIHQKL